MIHNELLEGMAGLLVGNSIDVPTHLLFSSTEDYPEESDSTVSGEAGARSTLTGTVEGNEVVFTGTRSSTIPPNGGTHLNVSALIDSSAGGDVWASALMSSTLHTTSYDLEVIHTIRIARD